MIQRRPTFLIPVLLLALAACTGQEEPTPTFPPPSTTESPTSTPTPEPTATRPAPSKTPTEMPPTDTPEPPATPTPDLTEGEDTVTPTGYWEGVIATSGVEIAINVEFNGGDEGLNGTIDIPQQGVAGLALDNILLEGDQLHFEIAAAGAVFDGTVTDESIAGNFEQGAAAGTFELTAAERVEEEPVEAADLPYSVEDVEWEIDDTVVDATLTIPEGSGPFPAIILIAGSGPTDRDWNSHLLPGSNGSGALFADALTRAGFVTLRYDKRVTGPNAATNLEKLMGKISLQSHLDELAGGVAYLSKNDNVDAGHIFALANSEGALHALNYQRQADENPLAGLILAAPPGRVLKDVLRTQLEAQLAETDDSEGMLALYDEAVERFLAGQPIEPDPNLPEGIQQLLQGFEAPVNLPFTREFLVVDPAEWLQEISVPVLVLIGKKDIQIDWQLDGGRLEQAAEGSDNVTFFYPENANHVFKFEEKTADQLSAADAITYNAAGRVLDEESLAAILDWLSDR